MEGMSALFEKLLKNSQKTGAFLKKSVMDAKGWDASIQDEAVSVGPVIFGYVWDYPTKWLMLLTIERNFFVETAERVRHESESNIKLVRQALGQMIAQFSEQAPTDRQKEHLGILLASYAGTTQAWGLLEDHPSGSNFITLNYRKPEIRHNSYLRPFAVPAFNNSPLDSDYIQNAIKGVVKMDGEKHPEWFL